MPRVLRPMVVDRGLYVLLRLHVVDADKDSRHSGLLQGFVSFSLEWGGPASAPILHLARQQIGGCNWSGGATGWGCNRSEGETRAVVSKNVRAVGRLTTAEVSVKQTSKPRAKA